MRLARRMLAMGMLGSSTTYPEVTAYYSSPGGAGDYMDAATNAAARAVFGGSAPVACVGSWVRFPSMSAGIVMSVRDGDSDPFPSVDLAPSIDALDVTLTGDTLSSADSVYSANPVDGGWHLIGCVLDGASVYAILDGIGAGAAYPEDTFAASDVLDAIGVYTEADICQPFILTRALSGAEIAAIYAAGPTVDIRNTIGAVDFLWRDADTAGLVANVGTGAACALTIHGSVTSEAL